MLEKGGVLHIRSILVVCRLKAKQVCLLHYFSLLTFCSFFSRYLSCVSQTMKKLQPFGDVPKKLTEQLRRSFVASRTFAQALLEGKQIVNKISKVIVRIFTWMVLYLRIFQLVFFVGVLQSHFHLFFLSKSAHLCFDRMQSPLFDP